MANATVPPLQLVSSWKFGSSLSLLPSDVRINNVVDPLLSRLHVWIIVLFFTCLVYTRYFTGLSHIPGPFIASVSNLWKIKAAWQEDMPGQNIALHKKYGPLVRIGPNMISVDEPSAMSVIYGFKPIYLKVSFSENFVHPDGACRAG
jgi:hypothetical protein